MNPNSIDEEEKQKIKFYGYQAQERILRPDQVFRGFLVSTLQCQDCFHTSSRHEFFLDLSLPISTEKKPPFPRNPRKTSPEPLSKHQVKKNKEKEKKSRRANKNKKGKDIDLETGIERSVDAIPEGNLINLNGSQSPSSAEQSDADVEDNLIDDGPNGTHTGYGPIIQPLFDTNGNEDELKSPVDPEKIDDIPENPDKDSDTMVKSNKIIEVGITQAGCKKMQSLTFELEDKLKIEDDEDDDKTPKKSLRKRTRTISHSDWCTTMAPRYQCQDEECSIQSCLSAFTLAEFMTGNNKVGCDACTEKINGKDGKIINTNATKQFLISSPPAILILHLKRFQHFGMRGSFRKATKTVDFPFIFDLASFCGSKVKLQHNIGVERHQKKLLYSLYGIVEHSGSMHGGHYVAYVKVRSKLSSDDHRSQFLHKGTKAELDQVDELIEILQSQNDSDDSISSSSSSSGISPGASESEEVEGAVGGSDSVPPANEQSPEIEPPPGKWYYVSDSHVSEVSEDQVLKAQAYLLFYERLI